MMQKLVTKGEGILDDTGQHKSASSFPLFYDGLVLSTKDIEVAFDGHVDISAGEKYVVLRDKGLQDMR